MEQSCTPRFRAPVRPCSEISILLIDDDESFRSALAANLRDDGHRVDEYGSPAELPPLARLGEFALVVTDYEMPSTEGLVFADAFHAVHPAVPVVLVTAQWSGGLDQKTERRGFVHLRRKPLDYGDLHVFLHELASSTQHACESPKRLAHG